MKTNLRSFAVCLVGLTLAGCKTGAPTATVASNPGITPLPSIEREIGPDGSEVVAAPPADGEAAPRTWTQKITAFCVPKAPQKSNSNRVYESDSVPYTD